MARNVTQKLIADHIVEGGSADKLPAPGTEIGIRIDQTLTQDATGTMVMLEFEAMRIPQVKTELSAQYVDHNLLQTDFKNPDDHLFLQSACEKFGAWYSRPGNGISHVVHMERFGKPGKTLLGSDSHTPAAGALGMLSIGAGGLEVAMAMAGEPYYVGMPEVWGVKLTGELPDWVSAKDVILTMLQRHDVDGGVGRVIEYYGPGLETLSAMDRHVIANMGTELGATSTVFPADAEVRRFLKSQDREDDFTELLPDDGAEYDVHEEIDLSTIVPMIAKPSSPGNVVPVSEVAGQDIYQSYIGSSANPGWRDFAVAAEMVAGRQVKPEVSFDVNPSSRQVMETLMDTGHFAKLIRAGGRQHQTGCNGCIGMGQAPATGQISLRTVPRNFPGRSGTKEDAVYLVSPETAAASALTGRITDPREWAKESGMDYPRLAEPDYTVNRDQLVPPRGHRDDGAPADLEAHLEGQPAIGSPSVPTDEMNGGQATESVIELVKGPNIKSLPPFAAIPDTLEGPVLLKLGDDVSTDEIMPAGSRVLPYRSNVPGISRFVFGQVDESYPERALEHKEQGHFVVAGENYGQGSSREHAALAPRYLGVRMKLVKSYARIHRANLMNFGILPLVFADPADHDKIDQGDTLRVEGVREALENETPITVENVTKGERYAAEHGLTGRQVEMILKGSLIDVIREARGATA